MDNIKELLEEKRYLEALLIAGYNINKKASVSALVEGSKSKDFHALAQEEKKAVLDIFGYVYLMLLKLRKAVSFFIHSRNQQMLEVLWEVALRHGKIDAVMKLKESPDFNISHEDYKAFIQKNVLPFARLLIDEKGFYIDPDIIDIAANELVESKENIAKKTLQLLESSQNRNLPRKLAYSRLSGDSGWERLYLHKLAYVEKSRENIDLILAAYCRTKGIQILKKLQEGDTDDLFPLASHIYLAEEAGEKIVIKENLRLFVDHSRLDGYTAEREVLESINHKNIVNCRGSFTVHGIEFLKLEFLYGENLERYSRKVLLPFAETLQVIRSIAEALRYLLEKGIIYLDIKDKNIMYAKNSTKLFDFGRAQFMPAGIALEEAVVPSVLSTPEFVPPELCHSFSAYPRSDVFSLGILWHRLLTLKNPFEVCDFLEGDDARESELIKFALPASLLEPKIDSRIQDEYPMLFGFMNKMLDKDHIKRPWPLEIIKFIDEGRFK
jgi:hypothetical protein